ncbi:MAG: nucleotidyltransferase domain-containing protein [Isosphaeraceae bacterium]
MQELPLGMLDEIARKLATELDPERIYLFGSRAWGVPTEDSDIDIMVVLSDLAESHHRCAVRARGCLRGVNVPIDILVRSINEFERFRTVFASLEAKIFQEGRILFERNEIGTCSELASQGRS